MQNGIEHINARICQIDVYNAFDVQHSISTTLLGKNDCRVILSYNSNSSSLCLFRAIWLAVEKILHFNKFHEQESRTIFLPPAPHICNNIVKIRFWWQSWNYKEWMLLLWMLSMCKLRRSTHKLYIKPWVYTSIKSTKLNFIPILINITWDKNACRFL